MSDMGKNKKTIYIPIEVKVRELASQTLLAAYAAMKGFRVYIGTKRAIGYILRAKGNGGIYFYKGCHPEDYMRFIKNKCDFFVVLDQEIGPVVSDYENKISMRFRPGSLPFVDRYYSIGDFPANIARRALKNLSGKVVVTGWPRVDLWRDEFKGIYEGSCRKYKNKFGDFILFSSDFGSNSDESIEKRYLYDVSCGNTLLKRNAMKRKRENEKRNMEFKKFVEMLKTWDKDPEIPKIIVRPHPSEDLETWNNAINGLKKTLCIREGDIGSWVLAAKGVLHRGCTTAVQSYISGIPAAFVNIHNSEIRHGLPYKLSTVIRDIEELKKWTKEVIRGNANKKADELALEELNRRVHVGKKLSVELIVEDLMALEVTPEPSFESKNHWEHITKIKYKLKGIKENFKLWFSKKKGDRSGHSKITPFDQKVPGGITDKEINELLAKIRPEKHFKVARAVKNAIVIEENDSEKSGKNIRSYN